MTPDPTPLPPAPGELRGGRLPTTRVELRAAVDSLVVRVQDAPRPVAGPDVKALVAALGAVAVTDDAFLDRVLVHLETGG